MILLDSRIEDLYNRKNTRNIQNADKFYYNCGGYALECFSWWKPTHVKYDDYGNATPHCLNDAIEEMLEEFPDLRRITSIDEVNWSKENAIGFRFSGYDFHFVKKMSRRGKWFHKMGSCNWIAVMPESEVFGKHWYKRYIGETILFAKKKGGIK